MGTFGLFKPQAGQPVADGPTGLVSWCVVDADPSGVLVRPAGTIALMRDGSAAWWNNDGTATGWRIKADLVGGFVPMAQLPLASIANLTNHDKLRYEAITILGGDGSLYTDFFDDFDEMISSGNGAPATSYNRPRWGFKLNGTDGNIGNESVQGLSRFALQDGTLGQWVKWKVLPRTPPIGQQRWYFTAKGIFDTYGNSGVGDCYVQINNGASTVSIGIKNSIHAHDVLLFDAVTSAHAHLGTESPTVEMQVDVYCLADSVLHYRVNGGNWGTMAYNLGLTPPVPNELDLAQSSYCPLILDWVGVFAAK